LRSFRPRGHAVPISRIYTFAFRRVLAGPEGFGVSPRGWVRCRCSL